MKTLVSMLERFINRQQVYQIQFSYPCGWKTYASYHQKSDALLVLIWLKSQGLTNCRLITSTQSSTVGIEMPQMKLTYRGIAYTTNPTTIQTATEAKYRGQTYTATHTPEASTTKALTYRGVSYNAENIAVSQPSVSTDSTHTVPVFG